jgi:hypothetical protein
MRQADTVSDLRHAYTSVRITGPVARTGCVVATLNPSPENRFTDEALPRARDWHESPKQT